MTEKQPHHANGAPEASQDWPTLVGRAVDDVTRILQSEAHMLETSMGAALETRLASAIATLTVVAVMVCGGVCMLCAAILLLHRMATAMAVVRTRGRRHHARGHRDLCNQETRTQF